MPPKPKKKKKENSKQRVQQKKKKNDKKENSTLPILFLSAVATVVIIWSVIVIYLTFAGIFFKKNEHYTIKKITIQNIDRKRFSSHELYQYLAKADEDSGAKVVRNETNIYKINVKALRKYLEDFPGINFATVQRRIPNTLILNCHERLPIAVIKTRDAIWYIDDNDILFLEKNLKTPSYPLFNTINICGVRKISQFHNHMRLSEIEEDTNGDQIFNPKYLLAATKFIKLISIHKDYKYFDIKRIQLDYDKYENRIIVHLNAKYTFRDGARIIIPIKNMEESINARLIPIIKKRSEKNQPTIEIDATYKKNVPVKS